MGKGKKPKLTPQETLERFIYRAKRVECHSLVQSGAAKYYATPKLKMTLGQSEVENFSEETLFEEEAFESLAARLRPFLVKSEPMHLPNVISKIGECATKTPLPNDDADAINRIGNWFDHRYDKKDSIRYIVQPIDKNGDPEADYLSDAILAESWMYSDLIHADPDYEKAEGLKLDYLTRYTAAVSYFSELSMLIVKLLNLVRSLNEQGLLHIQDSAWASPANVSEAIMARDQDVSIESLYAFPAGTVPPDGVPLDKVPGGVCLREGRPGGTDHRREITVRAFDRNDAIISTYNGYQEDTGHCIRLVIEDALKMTFPKGRLSQQQPGSIQYGLTALPGLENRASAIADTLLMPNYAITEIIINGIGHKVRLDLPRD